MGMKYFWVWGTIVMLINLKKFIHLCAMFIFQMIYPWRNRNKFPQNQDKIMRRSRLNKRTFIWNTFLMGLVQPFKPHLMTRNAIFYYLSTNFGFQSQKLNKKPSFFMARGVISWYQFDIIKLVWENKLLSF